MLNSLLQKKQILGLLIIGLIIVLAISGIFIIRSRTEKVPLPAASAQVTPNETEPRILSVKPDLTDGPVILPNQSIEITFNLPIENTGEFKHRFETFTDYTLKLDKDRKILTITPTRPYDLGRTYTIFIEPGTKFEGSKTFGHEEHFTFRTIQYRGV